MIRSLRHRGLKRLFRDGDASGVRADQRARITDVLAHLIFPVLSSARPQGRVAGKLEHNNQPELSHHLPVCGR